MPYIMCFVEFILSCGAVLLAARTSPEPRMEKGRIIWVLVGAALLGGLCGFILPARVTGWTEMLRMCVITVALAGASYCDLDRCRIPNLYPLTLAAGMVLLTLLDLLTGREETLSFFVGGLIGGGVMLLTLCLLRFLSRGGIGFGDIKLMTGIGMILGLYGAFSVMLFGQIMAVLCAVVLLAMKKITMKGSLPFAPFFYIGFTVTLWLGTF